MSHDKVKRAARKRMAETGEPYTLARRMVIGERARLKADEPEVTPENAPQLYAEGKITLNQAREAHGLPPFDPPLAPLVIPAGAGDWLRAILGPHDPEPSAGPPYTHVLKLPETEEEMAAEPMLPRYTVTDGEARERALGVALSARARRAITWLSQPPVCPQRLGRGNAWTWGPFSFPRSRARWSPAT